MKKHFCTYEISLKLKELGFNENCFGYWRNEEVPCPLTIGKITTEFDFDDEINYPNFKCLAPLWQQVIYWLIEKHNIDIKFEPTIENTYEIFISTGTGWRFYKSLPYYEAQEQSILKCIELIQK
jgi:hypothetical protein